MPRRGSRVQIPFPAHFTMDVKTKKLTGATAEITVTNTPEEVEAAFKKAYEKARASVKIPGFRKGKAPLEMVEKQLGDSVINDAARALVAESYEKAVDDMDPAPINVPSFEIQSFDRNEGAVFTGQYDIFPEVKLGKYKKVKVEVDFPSVSDKTVDEEIEKIRQAQAVLQPREDETAKDEDFVTMDINITEGKKKLYNGNDQRFKVGGVDFPPGINDRVKSMKVGDNAQYETEVPEDFQDNRFAGKTVNVDFTIKQIQFAELPEVDDEFAKDQGEYESLADFRKKIKEEIQKACENILESRAKDIVLKEAVKEAQMDVPGSMIETELEHRIRQVRSRLGNDKLTLPEIAVMAGRTVEDLEKEFMELSEQAVRDKMVLREVAEKEDIKVTDEEVDEEFTLRWSQYMAPEQVENFKKNQNMRDEIHGRLLYDRTMKWLLDNADQKKGKEVTYEKLVEEGAFNNG